jgi:flagellar biosynthetic protein FlhB
MPGDRTEKATPQRREKARKDGDLLYSRDFTSAAGTLAGVMTLGWFSGKVMEVWRADSVAFLDLGSTERWEASQVASTLSAIRGFSITILAPIAIIMASVAAAALLAGALQTGGVHINARAVGFHVDRINPFSNAKRLFSARAAARLGKSLVPAALLAVFAAHRIARELWEPPFSFSRLEELGRDVYGLLLAAAWLLFGWALVDYAVEWRSREDGRQPTN